ncbi:MAG TPA: glycosyltransferase family 4 protein [Pseudonocardiaceae bacterium]|nr:glycosyltransferase family 4 protein [Pseudonocardiaceae bacterium]
MRICQIVNVGFEAGGAERSVRLIAEGLRERGHEVLVIATDHLIGSDKQGAQQVFADFLVPAIRGNAGRRLAGYFWHHRAYRQVKLAVSGFRPDVVHLHTIGEFSPSVLAATEAFRRVLTVHGPEDWTARLLKWNLTSMAGGVGRLSPVDAARHAYLMFLQRPAYRFWLRRLDGVIAPSRFLAEAVGVDVGRVPIRVLPNGAPLPSATPLPGSANVLFVGRLEPVKGVRVLISAFARIADRHPEAGLTLVGDGEQRAELERQVAGAGLAGRVRFAGWLDGGQLAAAYAGADLLAIPSVWPENFPTVALEALGAGRAVVASRVGGIPELVEDGHNGMLVTPNDDASLADALDRLLRDPTRMAEMGAAAAARSGAYGVAIFLDSLEKYYAEVSNRDADSRGRRVRTGQPWRRRAVERAAPAGGAGIQRG